MAQPHAPNGETVFPALGGVIIDKLAPGVVLDAIGSNGAKLTKFYLRIKTQPPGCSKRDRAIWLPWPTASTKLLPKTSMPPHLGQIKSALSEVARQEKTLLWDWGRSVGQFGRYCALARLAAQTLPLARPDLVHLTPEGYRMSAESLLHDLLRLAGVEKP